MRALFAPGDSDSAITRFYKKRVIEKSVRNYVATNISIQHELHALTMAYDDHLPHNMITCTFTYEDTGSNDLCIILFRRMRCTNRLERPHLDLDGAIASKFKLYFLP